MERRKFTREFKLEAVRLIKDRGVSYAQAEQDLSVHQSQLRSWVTTRIVFVIAAVAGICCAMPAGAEEVGVGVTVGSGHEERDGDKTVVIKKDHDRDADKKVVIKKDRDHDSDGNKTVIIKKDRDHD